MSSRATAGPGRRRRWPTEHAPASTSGLEDVDDRHAEDERRRDDPQPGDVHRVERVARGDRAQQEHDAPAGSTTSTATEHPGHEGEQPLTRARVDHVDGVGRRTVADPGCVERRARSRSLTTPGVSGAPVTQSATGCDHPARTSTPRATAPRRKTSPQRSIAVEGQQVAARLPRRCRSGRCGRSSARSPASAYRLTITTTNDHAYRKSMSTPQQRRPRPGSGARSAAPAAT